MRRNTPDSYSDLWDFLISLCRFRAMLPNERNRKTHGEDGQTVAVVVSVEENDNRNTFLAQTLRLFWRQTHGLHVGFMGIFHTK